MLRAGCRWHLYNAGEGRRIWGREAGEERCISGTPGHHQQQAQAPNQTKCGVEHAEYRERQGYRRLKGHRGNMIEKKLQSKVHDVSNSTNACH